MKKMLIAALLLLNASVYASSGSGKNGKENEKGNHVSVSQIPGWVLAQFNAMFPGATNVQWEIEKEHGAIQYKAEFYLKGQKMKARF
ncbi:MAG: hypothetical protein QM802_23225 [Agriterribacter sp.]